MAAYSIQVSGRVVRQLVNRGSKSERNAILLETDQGSRYVLRRRGMPAHGDAWLDTLIGASIEAEGTAIGSTLLLDSCKFID